MPYNVLPILPRKAAGHPLHLSWLSLAVPGPEKASITWRVVRGPASLMILCICRRAAPLPAQQLGQSPGWTSPTGWILLFAAAQPPSYGAAAHSAPSQGGSKDRVARWRGGEGGRNREREGKGAGRALPPPPAFWRGADGREIATFPPFWLSLPVRCQAGFLEPPESSCAQGSGWKQEVLCALVLQPGIEGVWESFLDILKWEPRIIPTGVDGGIHLLPWLSKPCPWYHPLLWTTPSNSYHLLRTSMVCGPALYKP